MPDYKAYDHVYPEIPGVFNEADRPQFIDPLYFPHQLFISGFETKKQSGTSESTFFQ